MENPKPQRRRAKRAEKKREKKIAEKAAEKAVSKVESRERRRRTPRRRRETILQTENGEARFESHMTPEQEERVIRRLQKRMKNLQGKEAGPKTQSVMRTTLTMGVVTAATSNTLARHMRTWLNPCLLKPNHSGAVATPLTTRASQYNLWKTTSMQVRVTPLVSQAVVAGTILLVDIDQESSAAKPDTVDSVKARPHVELQLGKAKTWMVPPRSLRGPRSGWWYIDTNEDPSQSLGPALNIWTYIQTQMLVSSQTKDPKGVYDGPIFLLELTCTYHFANYNPKPALATLTTHYEEHNTTDQEKVQFENGSNGELLLSVENGTALAKYTSRETGKPGSKSEVLWAVGSKVVDVISESFGPWGWLIKGGWWVIRKIFNAPGRNTKTYFQVYASVEDAIRDNPIYQEVPNGGQQQKLPVGPYHAIQLNAQNLQDHPTTTEVRYVTQPPPVDGDGDPLPPDEITSEAWLPLSHAPIPEALPPPLYQYNQDKSYTPKYTGVNWNGMYCIFARPDVKILRAERTGGGNYKPLPQFGIETIGYQKWKCDVGVDPTGHKQGDYLVVFDILETGVFYAGGKMGTEWTKYGVVHTADTLLHSLELHPETDWKINPLQVAAKQDFIGVQRTCQMDQNYQKYLWGMNEEGTWAWEPTEGKAIVMQVALWGDPKRRGVLVMDLNHKSGGIAQIITNNLMLPDNWQKFPFCASTLSDDNFANEITYINSEEKINTFPNSPPQKQESDDESDIVSIPPTSEVKSMLETFMRLTKQ
nr:capsid protein [Astroviridae sp.]